MPSPSPRPLSPLLRTALYLEEKGVEAWAAAPEHGQCLVPPGALGFSAAGVASYYPTCHHARPFDTSIKSHFWMILFTFGDKCPQNGSKNGLRAPRTGMGYHHEGPSVDQIPGRTFLERSTRKSGSLLSFVARPSGIAYRRNNGSST